MKNNRFKRFLLEIAHKVDENTTLEGIYKQLSLLEDIEESGKE